VTRTLVRESARKTVQRLFLKDSAIADPLDARSKNFKALPKRRGGVIWTKRPNKIHPNLVPGTTATIEATPQVLRDLNSVAAYVQVK
ncbi:MAG: hypothetical protein IT440_07575, partial [Phycisphaeraceae bacterium]|nr:hypothetical protein [Phycisphaeraceae bacterium]